MMKIGVQLMRCASQAGAVRIACGDVDAALEQLVDKSVVLWWRKCTDRFAVLELAGDLASGSGSRHGHFGDVAPIDLSHELAET